MARVPYLDVADLASEPKKDGSGHHGWALVRREGALAFPVDVALFGSDGEAHVIRWDGVGPWVRVPWDGRSALVRAAVDPSTRVLLDVMSLDELTIEASVRLLNVLDAPTVTSGDAADEEDDAEGGDDTLIDAEDATAETEAEALAEADGAAAGEGGEAANGDAGEEVI